MNCNCILMRISSYDANGSSTVGAIAFAQVTPGSTFYIRGLRNSGMPERRTEEWRRWI